MCCDPLMATQRIDYSLVSSVNGAGAVDFLNSGFGVAFMLYVTAAQNQSIQVFSYIQLA